MSRPVHYAAATTAGMVFDCYRRAMQAHIDSGREVQIQAQVGSWSAPSMQYAVPAPRKHTNLDRVTCLECWASIEKMARAKRGA